MAKIVFLGGARQLGGNQFLLIDGDTKVFLDFGSNFDTMGKYYLFPSSAKKFRALQELIRLGIYPNFNNPHINLDGVYRQDYLRQMGRTPTSKPELSGAIFSHSHIDHIGALHFMRPDIHAWMDRFTKRIVYTMQEIGGAPFSEYIDFRYEFESAPKLREAGRTWVSRDLATTSRDIRLMKPPEPFRIGNIRFVPHYVDHSVPACGLDIYTSDGVFLKYSGDIRLRGRHPEYTEDFLAGEHPDYFLMEGSLIHKVHPGTEDELIKTIAEFIRDRKGLVMASSAPRDLERLLTLYKVARKVGRTLVIDARTAYLLDKFAEDPETRKFKFPRTAWKHIAIYMPRKNKGMLDRGDGEDRDYPDWERHYIDHPSRLTNESLRADYGKFLVCMTESRLSELTEIEPPEDSVYFRSHAEPYTDEMVLGEKVAVNWMDKFNLRRADDKRDLFGSGERYEIPHAHVTGHGSYEDTEYMVNRVAPGVLVPIHTLEPEKFGKMYKGNVWIPELGSVLELKKAA